MNRGAWSALGLVVVLVSGCASAVSGVGVSAPQPSSPASSTPAAGSPAALPFLRTAADSELGDPPVADVCKTLGAVPFRALGYYASTPEGSRAAGCTYFLNKAPTNDVVRPDAYLDVRVDTNVTGSSAPNLIGPYGLLVTPPTTAGAPCVDDVLTHQLEVDIQALSGRTLVPTKTLCALALAVAHRAATVMQSKGLVKRAVAANSLTQQDLCVATDSTAAWSSLVEYAEQDLGFEMACQYYNSTFDYWVELRSGIQPGDVRSSTEHASGHTFLADLEPDNGYCRYRWQGPAIPGTGLHEELTVRRTALAAGGVGASCVSVGVLAGELITALGRH